MDSGWTMRRAHSPLRPVTALRLPVLGLYLHGQSCLPSDAGLARFNAKNSELTQLDALPAAHGAFEGFEDRFDGLLRFGSADIRFRYDCVYDVQLNHAVLRNYVARC